MYLGKYILHEADYLAEIHYLEKTTKLICFGKYTDSAVQVSELDVFVMLVNQQDMLDTSKYSVSWGIVN